MAWPTRGQESPDFWDEQMKEYIDVADATKVSNAGGVTAVWTGTQAQYDAIVTKSATTLYVVV